MYLTFINQLIPVVCIAFCTVGFALFCDFPIYTTVCIQSIRYIFIYLAKFLFLKTHRDLKIYICVWKFAKTFLIQYTSKNNRQKERSDGVASPIVAVTILYILYCAVCIRVKWFLRKHIWNIFTYNPKNTLVQRVLFLL